MAAFHGQTEGIMVTTGGFQSGVLTLAKHYRRVELIQATSLEDLRFQFGENLRIVTVTPTPASAGASTGHPIVGIS